MRKLITALCLSFAVLLGSIGSSSALPPCPLEFWHNCFGTLAFANGDKYVGEFKEKKPHGAGTFIFANGENYAGEFRDGMKHGQGATTLPGGSYYVAEWKHDKVTKIILSQPSSETKKTIKMLREKVDQLQKVRRHKTKPSRKKEGTGSGFFISKEGHIITNQHVIEDCKKITVGDNSNNQVAADVLEIEESNDLALLKISLLGKKSIEKKSLVYKLSNIVAPFADDGLMRSEDVKLGEEVMVAGFPYGYEYSDVIKVTGGMVSADRGLDDDRGQFQMDAAVQSGSSGGPVYDMKGNIVGVVVSQLDKFNIIKDRDNIPENYNFGIKASIVKKFLSASGLPTKSSSRSKTMPRTEIAAIARSQTVMVMCIK